MPPAALSAANIERQLRAHGDPARAQGEKRYLKSDLMFFGVSVPDIRKIVKASARQRPGLDHDYLVDLVAELWSDPVHELRMAAAELLRQFHRLLTVEDLGLLERLIRESRTWALVDPLSADVAGEIVIRFRQAMLVLDAWAADEDFWVRRAALLALMRPLKRGGDFTAFARYADAMLDDKEFFVRKAIGWVLREVAKTRPDEVFEWLAPRAHRASGVTLREAVKYLGDDQRARVLRARQSGGGRRAAGN